MKSALLIVVCLAIVSTFFYITISSLYNDEIEYSEGTFRSNKLRGKQKLLTLDDSTEHLMWFVQVNMNSQFEVLLVRGSDLDFIFFTFKQY